MWEEKGGGVVTGGWRGLGRGDVIGRAGLAEDQSALTDRGGGDARRWSGWLAIAGATRSQ